MTTSIPKDNILGYECRFATYCRAPGDGNRDDLHVVKEIIHTKDGKAIPNLRMMRNYKRPYWVTKRGFQTHQDKKEWEKLEHLDRFDSTQSDLLWNAAKALGEPWFKGDMRKLSSSPYLYGTDILSTATLKQMYMEKFPELITPYSMAAFDTEKDVVRGTNEINMATISYGSKVFTAVQKWFVDGHSDVINQLQAMLTKYLGQFVESRKIEWEVVVVDSEVAVIEETFRRAHQWQPDFMAIWNIDYDMPAMISALEKNGINPKDIFSDPRVPPQYRHFRYRQGPSKKITASGKVIPIKPAARWHTVYTPSSFYFVDAMCAYRHVRTGSAEEMSYALDAILDKEFKDKPEIRKLKFEAANGLRGIDWHQFMQEKYPLEYIIYNVFDCISMELLDEKTNDLRLSMPMMSGCSDFENFRSQPRRLADSLHYFSLQNGRAIGTTSGEMATKLDKHTLGLDGWIVTLPAHLVVDNGLRIIAEDPKMATNIRGHVGDLDVSASYPNGGSVFNISKETTRKELCKVRGVDEFTQRMQGINFSAGATNAVEFCTSMYGLPSMDTLLQAFERDVMGVTGAVDDSHLLRYMQYPDTGTRYSATEDNDIID